MKFLVIALAFAACAYADVSEIASGYNYPAPAPPQQTYIPPAVHHEELSEPIQAPVQSYLPPASHHEHHEVHHEVHHEAPVHISAPAPQYIAPAVAPIHHEVLSQPVSNYLPPQQQLHVEQPVAHLEHHGHAHVEHYEQPHVEHYESAHDDGYRYKTVRRVVYRHRQ